MRRAGPRRAAGMTLVELMVGLAVGLFVSLIAISVFVSTRTLNVVNSAGARMGENARLAMEALQDDLRSASFQACQDPTQGPPANRLNAPAAAAAGFLADPAVGGVFGHRGTGTGAGTSFTPALNAALAALPAASRPSDDSDVISVRVPIESQGWAVTQTMAADTSDPVIGTAGPGAASTLQAGDIVLISDCRFGDIFQVTGMPAGTGMLQHVVGVGTPGNAVASLSRRYRDEAVVYRLQTRHYYVAPSALRPGTRSLWRLAVPCPGCAVNPQELASGVERLSVAWGIDTDPATVADKTVNLYRGADALALDQWPRVVSARLQMLVSTAQDNMAQSAAASVAFGGGTVTPGDRRLRTVLTELVALRNRTP